MKPLSLLVALILMLSGCVSPLSGLQKSADFSEAGLKQGGMTVGPVVSAIGTETLEATRHYDAVLARHLTDRLKSPVTSNQCLSKNELIGGQLKNGTPLSSETKSAIINSHCSSRYVVLVRLERDEITQHRDVRQDYVFLQREPSLLMRHEDTMVEIDFIRERKLVAAFWIIDGRTGESVWSAAVSASEPNISRHSRIFPALNMLNQIWADDYTRSLPEDNMALYPPPVTREAVWEALSKTFAAQITK